MFKMEIVLIMNNKANEKFYHNYTAMLLPAVHNKNIISTVVSHYLKCLHIQWI